MGPGAAGGESEDFLHAGFEPGTGCPIHARPHRAWVGFTLRILLRNSAVASR